MGDVGRLSNITDKKWAEIVKNSPYVFLTDEVDSYAQEVEFYALDEFGNLDESKPLGSTFMPNLYFPDTKSPFKYFVSRTAFHADIDYIGEFFFSTYDYDTDYPELEDTGFEVYDLEELENLMTRLIPEKEYLKLEKEGKLKK